FMGNGRRGNITDQRRQRGYHGEAFSTSSLHRGSFASMPMTHFSVNALIELTVNSIASSILSVTTGIVTFNSKFPVWQQSVIVASQPTT
ncbi:MAG TPA: hypothetical protein VFP18_09030, partial [Candidatus Binatia bacterium]|nr:hypothetical protein [Candidatus Binatia bacterium]